MSLRQQWWASFFSGLCLDVQRNIATVESTRAEVEFIERLLGLAPQARVLDVPCGEGRHSLELASRGYQVTGVDVTLPLLMDARRKAAERQLDVTFEQRDMRDLRWQEAFDVAFCYGGSLGYFDDVGNLDFLRAASSALKPGGRFLVETHVAETILPRFRERDWRRVGDVIVAEKRHYDHVHGCVDAEYTIVQAGKEEKKRSSVRIYTYLDLCRLLAEAGFSQCEGRETLSAEPFRLGSRRLTLVATKGHAGIPR